MTKRLKKNTSKNQWIQESVIWKDKKIDKHLTRLIKKKREKIQINKIRNKREIKSDTTETQRIVRNYYEQLYDKKLDNLGETDKLLETYSLPSLNQEGTENLNRPITTSETDGVKKKKPPDTKKAWIRCPQRKILPNIQRTNIYPSQMSPKN